jgi:epoxide hydrolase 4
LALTTSLSIVQGRYIEVASDIRLHVVQCGDTDKPLMVLLHGFPEFWRAWQDVMPQLAQHYCVIAPDLRGFNLSSKPAPVREYAAKYLVSDVLQLIAQWQVLHKGTASAQQPPILVAHDWGGAVAWNVAAQHPDKISKLAIINSPHPYTFWRDLRDDAHQQAASQYMNWLRKPGCEQILAQDNFKRLEDFFLNMGGAQWFTPATRAAYHEAWAQPGALTGGCNFYRASPLHPPEPGATGAGAIVLDPQTFRVQIPCLVIWGENDIALPIKLLEGIEPYIDQLTVKRYPDATHWILHEQPQAVSQDLIAWLGN